MLIFRKAVAVWPPWAGSAVQQAACVQQRSRVPCLRGARDLRLHGHGAGHMQLVLGSHCPLQHWGGGTGDIQPDPAALVSVEGQKQG